MSTMIERYSVKHRAEAFDTLRTEIAEFAYDALTTLLEDLKAGRVKRGSWAGCVLSYKSGAPGSCRRDSMGRAANAFTVLYDNRWLTDEDVIAEVEAEIERRRPSVAEPAPARTETERVPA